MKPDKNQKTIEYNQPLLTDKKLDQMLPGEIINIGITTNDEQGVYMTEDRKGTEMIWVAKRGGIGDWAIYADWKENGAARCISNGQKVTSEANIRKLVPCTDEAYKRYRQ